VRNAGRGSKSTSQGTLHLACGQGDRGTATLTKGVQHRLADLRGLYKGVFGAATGAGIIIGTYFAFYSTTKNALRRHTDMHEGMLCSALASASGTLCSYNFVFERCHLHLRGASSGAILSCTVVALRS
jgi:hypothetical protein